MNDAPVPAGSTTSSRIRPGAWIALCLGAIVLLLFLFWPVTDWMARHDVHGIADREKRIEQLREARDAARGRLLQVGAGLLAMGALIYTARNFTLARRQSELSQRTLELAQRQAQVQADQARDQSEAGRRTLELTAQGQATDRFTRAVEQLGASAVEVRIGGIYALERIARDSATPGDSGDHPGVMAVLATFVREHSHDSWPEDQPLPYWAPVPEMPGRPSNTRPRTQPPLPDVQAALSVIGRRSPEYDLHKIDLTGANLGLALLNDMDFSGVDFYMADLTGVELKRTKLRDARLVHAVLRWTSLEGTDFSGADLTAAKFEGTNLSNAIFDNTNLLDAVTDEETRFPRDWRRR